MKKRTVILLRLLGCLTACSGAPPTPDWVVRGHDRLEDFKVLYLQGESSLARVYFHKAVEEIRKSGNPAILGRAYLIRMAVETAVLEFPQGDEFPRINAAFPDPSNQAYHDFLAGPTGQVNLSHLPETYRAVAKILQEGRVPVLADELARIENPLSRLIATAVCLRQGHGSEAVLVLAADTASREGWKKALLAYLDRLETLYRVNGREGMASSVRERIRLMEP